MDAGFVMVAYSSNESWKDNCSTGVVIPQPLASTSSIHVPSMKSICQS